MLPVLFNLYFAPVFEKWHAEMERPHPNARVSFRYNINSNLFNCQRIRRNWTEANYVLVVPSVSCEQCNLTEFYDRLLFSVILKFGCCQ